MSDPQQRSKHTPPSLVVGNIEIRDGQVIIGGSELTGGSVPSAAPFGTPLAPNPPFSGPPHHNTGTQNPFGYPQNAALSGMQAPQAGYGMQAPQAGYGMQAPQAGYGMQAPQAGYGMQAPQAGYGMLAPQAGYGTQTPPNVPGASAFAPHPAPPSSRASAGAESALEAAGSPTSMGHRRDRSAGSAQDTKAAGEARPTSTPPERHTEAGRSGLLAPQALAPEVRPPTQLPTVMLSSALRHPLSTREKVGITSSLFVAGGMVVQAAQLGISLVTAVGIMLPLLSLFLGLWLWRRTVKPPVDDAPLERALVLLADQHGGRLKVVDIVRAHGLSFDEAQAILNRLVSKGHAVLEFDPETQGPVYRLG